MKYEILTCEKGSSLFPKHFIERKGFPERFFYKGDISFLNELHAVAIIGSRNAPKEAILSAYASGQYAAMEGYAVVNGLAVGCDMAALRGALSEGGKCVAILPCGLDMVVPSVNEYLAEEILEKGGCLISEYGTGTEPEKYKYVQRDRLQSGLSEAVLVVHYGEDSGTLKTAEFARKQGVKVIRYPDTGKDGDRDELLPFAETIEGTEAFKSFLTNYVPGETVVYEQMRLPFL